MLLSSESELCFDPRALVLSLSPSHSLFSRGHSRLCSSEGVRLTYNVSGLLLLMLECGVMCCVLFF